MECSPWENFFFAVKFCSYPDVTVNFYVHINVLPLVIAILDSIQSSLFKSRTNANTSLISFRAKHQNDM